MVSIRPACCATLWLLFVLHVDYVIFLSATFTLPSQTTTAGNPRVGFDRDVRLQTPHPLSYRKYPNEARDLLEFYKIPSLTEHTVIFRYRILSSLKSYSNFIPTSLSLWKRGLHASRYYRDLILDIIFHNLEISNLYNEASNNTL
jgi:hypothetical protein